MRVKIILSVCICLLVGFISGFATSSSVDGWYATLNKPIFNPPNWIFGPMWTILYVMMGVSAGIIWNEGLQNKQVKNALVLFGLHLLLNGFWSIAFFGLKQVGLALMVILALIIAIAVIIRKFQAIDPKAAYMLIPYFLWVLFATVLNFAIFSLN